MDIFLLLFLLLLAVFHDLYNLAGGRVYIETTGITLGVVVVRFD